jgi:rubrerythrin
MLFLCIPLPHSIVMSLFTILTDGSGRAEEDRHYECRTCGENLTADDTSCPLCGGDVAMYTL